MRRFFVFVLAVACCVEAMGQGEVKADYLSRVTMKDADGNSMGRGDLLKVSGRYTVPLSVRQDSVGRVKAWTATAVASFGFMDCEGAARELNPDRILNASVNVAHARPLGGRWRLMASLGVGVYAEPADIGFRSVLANGAAIFAYKVSDRLSIGVGGGLTNSYGVPMVLPMGYVSWKSGGRCCLTVDIANSPRVVVTTGLSPRFKLSFTAMEIDGLSAVTRVDGRSKIYSVMMMKSVLSATCALSRRTALSVGVGGNWLRSVRLSDRSLKGFFNTFGGDAGKYRFLPSMLLRVGLTY